MDLKTEQILAKIKSHSKIKNFLTTVCYLLIIGGIFVYIFHAFDQVKTIKLVNDYKENPQNFKIEKVMLNPRIKLDYEDNQIYDIRAKKALNKDESEVVLFDVFAEGKIGKITAGELKIDEDGNHLIFSKNPILILNEVKK